ncbi:hypothetical protein [Lysinibacillus sp. FSL M8-0134]|uniref:hypothetical protein n=1 Tax=Lysinibacillus sp. FSL M8-0134 TaxID=2921717 RepID=UPI00311A6126
METLLEYSGKLLRNFQVNILDSILNDYHPDPKEYRRIRNQYPGTRGWEVISDIINKLKTEDGFDDSKLEERLFTDLTENIPDNYYIYDFVHSKTYEEIVAEFKKNTALLNTPIYTFDIRDRDSLQIVSIRLKEKEKKIIILLRYGYTYGEESNTNSLIFFIPCVLDFHNKMLIIKFREIHRKKSKKKINKLLPQVINCIKNLNDDFTFNGYGKKKIHSTLYEMFKVESARAEKLIKSSSDSHTDEELNNNINTFLTKQLSIPASSKEIESYTNRIKSIYYQNIASQLEEISFGNRYMFAFAFFDGLSTKSTTRDAGRFNVYNKKLYWTLKDLIHTEQKITELSMYYKFNPKNFDAEIEGENFYFVEATLKESYGSLMIDFYKNKFDSTRGIRNGYVISEIKKYL